MFNYLLVPSTGSEVDRAVVQMALRVANPSSAHIEFLHVRMDIRRVMVMLAGSGMTLGTALVGLEQDADDRARLAQDGFRALCADYGLHVADSPRPGLSASWSTVTGEESGCLANRARTADAIAVGRGVGDDLIATEVLEGVLMNTGRPVLIAPTGAPPDKLQAIAIAWKDRPEAARAVTAAMPLIAEAERVVILSVSEHGAGEDASCRRLQRALRWHNPHVSVQHLVEDGRPAPRILMEAAGGPRVSANLLVMGGYGHARLREAMLGGFTQHVLAGSEIPILMVH